MPHTLRTTAPMGGVPGAFARPWRTALETLTLSCSGALYRAAVHLAGRLPRAWSVAIGRRGGELAWLFQSRRRRVLQENWRQLARRPSLALHSSRRTYGRFGEETVETMRLLHAAGGEIDRRVHFRGLEPIARAAADEGVLLLSLHSGNWEWAGAALARRGIPVQALARRHPEPVDDLLQSVRRRFGIRAVSRAADLRPRGSCIAYFLDRCRATATADPAGAARRAVALAARRGWWVAPCWIEREEGRGYRVHFGEPRRPGLGRATRQETTRAALAFLLARAVQQPEEWFAFDHLATPLPGHSA